MLVKSVLRSNRNKHVVAKLPTNHLPPLGAFHLFVFYFQTMELYSDLSLISDYKEETYDWMSSDDIDVDDYEYVQNLASGVASQSRYF